jgi:hypothetical protein
VNSSLQVAETEDELRAVAIRNPLADAGAEFMEQLHLLDEDVVAAIGDFQGMDGCFFMSLDDVLE